VALAVEMCGIFGFALKKPIAMVRIFEVLEKLEVYQYPKEKLPLGGYGAGIALLKDHKIVLQKVGSVDGSPANRLSQIFQISEASTLIAHVRMPLRKYMRTAKYAEAAQPYVAECSSGFSVASVHNGKVKNYMEIREELGSSHTFESEKIGLIDSEVIPHYFEDQVRGRVGAKEALVKLFSRVEGTSSACLLQVLENDVYLHFIHKGKTRGLTIWKNDRDELIFCSRKESLSEEFKKILDQGKFSETVSIPWRKDQSFVGSFCWK